ncbi:MAG: helix-turn-helix domain-containing protein [Reyranellaceae bacterium]
MALLDAAVRGGAVALFLLLASLLWRDGRRFHSAWAGCLLALSAAAYVVVSAQPVAVLDLATAPWVAPLRVISMSTPALFWLFSAACFDDEFQSSWWLALPWLGTAVLAALCLSIDMKILWWIYSALSLFYVAMAVWQAAIGRSTDLIEPRRRFRLVLIGLVALYVVVLVVGNLRQIRIDSPFGQAAESYGLLLLAAILTRARLTLRSTAQMAALGVSTGATEGPPPLLPAPAPVDPPAPEPADTALLAQLTRLMERERCYREDGFSIATLAGKMAIPEYRLRRLINQELGHRNFTAFVNGYRLAEAEAALADPAQDEVPILTIALDAGFQSVGPFNRAFKARTGLTPTEFRRARGRPAP